LLGSQAAVIMGMAYNFLPFMILPLYASVERLDMRMLDAAGDLYANGWNTFWKVIWPLSLPGVVSGTLLTFIPAAGDYINSALLGNTQTVMIGQSIDAQFLKVGDYPTAAALSVVLMIIIIALVAFYVKRAGTEELV
jgi:spermidine/putrescine transport system permease protein